MQDIKKLRPVWARNKKHRDNPPEGEVPTENPLIWVLLRCWRRRRGVWRRSGLRFYYLEKGEGPFPWGIELGVGFNSDFRTKCVTFSCAKSSVKPQGKLGALNLFQVIYLSFI